jgi:membrane protein
MRQAILKAWDLVRVTGISFVSDNALTHGAAMAFYTATSLAPILLIVVAIAGLFFGQDAARLALSAQISGLMGAQSAELLRMALENASRQSSGTLAAVIGVLALFVTASGVFGEMQLALNSIWKVPPRATTLPRLIRTRAASLGLVAALGFLLLVSLIASAAISALGDFINARLPFGTTILGALNGLVSFVLISVMFGAIYKVLPDRTLHWRDVATGALITSALFTIGKSLIGWYIGSSAVASSYGAAGGLLVMLLWVYYTSLIFLLGAEFTRAYSVQYGTRSDLQPVVREAPARLVAYNRQPSGANTTGLIFILLGVVAWTSAILTDRWWRSHH